MARSHHHTNTGPFVYIDLQPTKFKAVPKTNFLKRFWTKIHEALVKYAAIAIVRRLIPYQNEWNIHERRS
jgi:hypothetical protein